MNSFKKIIMKKIPEVYNFAKRDFEDLGPYGYRIGITSLFGYTPSDWEVVEIFKDHKGLTLKDFECIVTQKLEYFHFEQYLHDVFIYFDKDCKGFITLEDLLKAWQDLSEKPSWAKIRESFKEIAQNGSIGYTEFSNVLRSNPGEYDMSILKQSYERKYTI